MALFTSQRVKRAHPVWGWVGVVLGLYPIFIAFGVIPVYESTLRAPMWVVAVSGLVFVSGGCMILLSRRARLNNVFAALMCLSFAAIGIWVSLFAPPEGLSGGIPLVSDETNIKVARWVFGVGAVVAFGLFGYAVHRLFRRAA